MKQMKKCVMLALAFGLSGSVMAKPVKVFIMAGQSNMEGHARIGTFDYIGDDPATAPLLKKMRNADGTPKVCDHVWISYGDRSGKLTAGFGASTNEIGPEFTFGLTMDEKLDQPIVIIKTAWGGKSLHTDFRPPSAGPYELNDYQKKFYYGPPAHGRPANMDEWLAEKKKATGVYYRLMLEQTQKVLKDIKSVYPDYKEGQGVELAGFIWMQGWNDMCDNQTYPPTDKSNPYDKYSEWLADFIRDVRKDLSAPKMPCVIGVMGVGGLSDKPSPFREAMAAPASLPEFKGNVIAIQTAPFWDAKLAQIESKRAQIRQMQWMIGAKDRNGPNADGKMTPEEQQAYMKEYSARMITPADDALWKRGASNAGFHYLGCAKTFAQAGQAFADAVLPLQK